MYSALICLYTVEKQAQELVVICNLNARFALLEKGKFVISNFYDNERNKNFFHEEPLFTFVMAHRANRESLDKNA